MDGTARFLLGGAIGAALGYLLSQKNLQKAALEGMPGAAETVQAPVRVAPEPIATHEAAAPLAAVPVAAVIAPEAPLMTPPPVDSPYEPPVVELPVEPPLTESPYEPPVVEATEAEAPTAEIFLVETPVTEMTAAEAAAGLLVDEAVPVEEEEARPAMRAWWEVEPAVTEVPTEAESPAEEVSADAEAPTQAEDGEITFTKAFIDEPPTMIGGWTPTAPVVEEDDIEAVLPVVPDEFPSMEAAEIERMSVVERTDWAESSRSEHVAEVSEAETPLETAIIESLDFETPVVDEVVVEAPIGEEVVVEAPLVEETVAPASPAGTDDLRARIEETRRRIRQELEQPFISGAQAPAAIADDWTVAPAVPLAEPVAVSAPEIEEVVEAPSTEDAYEVGGMGLEEPVDYDSMRSRIEDVRSRLKAKAFDAMMSGESALLGRDAEGAQRSQVVPEVDSEVDETIESSLREEDN